MINREAIKLFRKQTKYNSFVEFLDNIEDFLTEIENDVTIKEAKEELAIIHSGNTSQEVIDAIKAKIKEQDD